MSAVYDYSNSFWLYANETRRGRAGSHEVDAAIEQIIAEAQSEAIIGPDGPLPGLGLVPLPANERAAQRSALAASDVASVSER